MRPRAARVAGADGKGLREGLTTVTFGTIALLVATLVLVVLNFLARVLIVRHISDPEWNAFSLGFTLAQVLVAIGSFGIPVAVARSLPYAVSDGERRTIVRTALTTGGVAAAAAGVSLALVAPLLGQDPSAPGLGLGLEFFAVAVACLIASSLLASIFQGFSNVLPNALFVQVLNPGLFLAFLGAALLLPPSRITFPIALAGYAVANAATLAALVVYSARRLPGLLPPAAPDPGARSRLVRLLAPLAVLGAMTSIAGSGDTLILGIYHLGEVGHYSVSLTLARLVQVGIVAASYIFLPVASRFLSRRDTRAVRLTYATLTKWLTLFSLPLFAVFFFLPRLSLDFVYGPSYATGIGVLEIVAAGAFAGTLLGPGSVTQVALGETRLVAYNSLAAGAADVVLALVLVPPFGAVGAAIAWASANVLFTGLCVAEIANLQGMHPFRRDFLAPVVATLLPVGLALGLLHPQLSLLELPVLVLAIAAVFLLAVILTRSVGEGDRLLLEAVEGWTGWRLPLARTLGRWGRSPASAPRSVPPEAPLPNGDSRQPPRP